jgi:hypothetical protein
MDDSRREKDKNNDCSQLPEDSEAAQVVAVARCNCLIDRYLRWKKKNHEKSDQAQRAALILTAITPVLLLVPWDYVNILAAATSARVAIATGLLHIYGWRENYIRYGYTWHALQTEKYRYLTHATKDYPEDDREKAAQTFARRIEQLVMAEVTDWRSEMQRIEKQNCEAE